jgi:hypothetical protein
MKLIDKVAQGTFRSAERFKNLERVLPAMAFEMFRVMNAEEANPNSRE